MTGRRSARATGSATAGLRRRWVAVAAAAAAVVVAGAVVTGVAVASGSGSAPVASASSSASPGSEAGSVSGSGSSSAGSSSDAAGDRDTTGFQDPAAPAAESDATPTRVSIPAIGVDASLEDLHRGSAGELDPPKGWDNAGWFSDGIVPGEVGPAVIAGHVDSPTSAAVFFRLDELVAGDEIHVAMSDGSTRTFTVQDTERASKSAFPTSDVYGTTPTPQLRLITCDGTFDTATGHYTDNLIVFASLSDR
ncbi:MULTISPECIES: class F sortase [unclassified Curtobacterium]|uniref:class F sortase n=1 Tax=unclassified Curtobacterium TaxID=257496 RepID=UPI0038291FEF